MFLGADVDGLDRMARECNEAAQVADTVRMAVEAVVAASWVFGPFGTAFIEYLTTVVIPWLTRVAAALRAFAQVLSANANEQRRVSAGGTGTAQLPAYRTPPLLLAAGTTAPAVAALAAGQSGTVTGARLGARSAPHERDGSGPPTTPITRTDPRFATLVRDDNPDIVFKHPAADAEDRIMAPRLKEKLDTLAMLVKKEWPGQSLRVTAAWDDTMEHHGNSLHYEGRAADLTVSDRDPRKLGRLYELANQAGLDWVFYEDRRHVHVSVHQ